MKTRSSSFVKSSLTTAAFRTVSVLDSRGLAYDARREIPTLRRMRATPVPMGRALRPCGRVRTCSSIGRVRP
jgi:hypothetical protein